MSEAPGPLTTTIEDGVAVLRFDDGKVNVLTERVIAAFQAALDLAESEASAVCIVGREGQFSAGFDLSVMTAGPDAARELVTRGGDFLSRLYLHPQPVVASVTGHALAAGVLLVLACDVRIGADAPAKIGLNESAIGMPLPLFAVELARERLDPKALQRATLAAELYDPKGAVEAGYLDRVASPSECTAVAIAEARRLAAYSSAAYAQTKQVLRGPMIDRVRAVGRADVERFRVDAAS